MQEAGDRIYKYQPLWGAWKVDQLIGKGSFGKVYEVYREDLGYKYTSAVKIVTVPSEDQYKEAEANMDTDEGTLKSYFEDIVKSIVHEINMLYKFRGHSNILSYEDHIVIKSDESLQWDILIRTELATSLSKHLTKQQMSRENIIRLGMDVCAALITCEKEGIIHRDIKDDNIFVSEMGDFKIGDFGIARELSKSGRAVSMRGTPLYMAPEVLKGERCDHTVDIYSLGIVLYRLLNKGRMPFMPPYPSEIRFRDSEAALDRRISGEALPLPLCADNVMGQIILKACAFNPNDRFKSATEMKIELEKALTQMSESQRNEPVTILKLKECKTATTNSQKSIVPQDTNSKGIPHSSEEIDGGTVLLSSSPCDAPSLQEEYRTVLLKPDEKTIGKREENQERSKFDLTKVQEHFASLLKKLSNKKVMAAIGIAVVGLVVTVIVLSMSNNAASKTALAEPDLTIGNDVEASNNTTISPTPQNDYLAPTASATPTQQPEIVLEVNPQETPENSAAVSSPAASKVQATSKPKSKPKATVKPTKKPTSTPTLVKTPTPTKISTPTPTPVKTATPMPTKKPTPTPTPAQTATSTPELAFKYWQEGKDYNLGDKVRIVDPMSGDDLVYVCQYDHNSIKENSPLFDRSGYYWLRLK